MWMEDEMLGPRTWGSIAPLLLASGETSARSKKFSRNFGMHDRRRNYEHTKTSIMAGIKRKSVVPTSSDSKSSTKKAKVEKGASKSDSKHAVKSVKKAKKAKVDSSDDSLGDSDTSEPENGLYGFSAKEDVEMSDAESSEDGEPMEDVKQDGKAHKRKTADESGESTKKPKSDAPVDSKLAELNGMLFTCRSVYMC
jgi:hypothetical protein